MSRTILDDLADLPEPQRAAFLAAFEEMREAAFLQGYLAAHLWWGVFVWRYGRR